MNTATTDTNAAQWSRLLNEAVTRPGLLLAAYSAFHNYSIGNQVLALVQCEQRGIQPGPLSTFPGWKEKGRFVRKGERALTLCMPITCKDTADPDARFTRFVYKPRWFVLAQTDGEPVAALEPPAWSYALALQTLAVTETTYETTDGNTQGYAKGRTIAINPLAQMPHKTRFHELAHVTLGRTAEGAITHDATTPRSLREAEGRGRGAYLLRNVGASRRGVLPRLYPRVVARRRDTGAVSAEDFHAADLIIKAGRPQPQAEALAA